MMIYSAWIVSLLVGLTLAAPKPPLAFGTVNPVLEVTVYFENGTVVPDNYESTDPPITAAPISSFAGHIIPRDHGCLKMPSYANYQDFNARNCYTRQRLSYCVNRASTQIYQKMIKIKGIPRRGSIFIQMAISVYVLQFTIKNDLDTTFWIPLSVIHHEFMFVATTSCIQGDGRCFKPGWTRYPDKRFRSEIQVAGMTGMGMHPNPC